MHVIWWLYFALNIAKDNSGYERSASPRPGGSGIRNFYGRILSTTSQRSVREPRLHIDSSTNENETPTPRRHEAFASQDIGKLC